MVARRAKTCKSSRVSNRDRRLGPWFRLLADIETGRDEPEPHRVRIPAVPDAANSPTIGHTGTSRRRSKD